MAAETKKLDAVFEGGGVKGIGLAGAVAYAQETGWDFQNVAGTSAGAIIAALVASGYDAAGLKKIMDDLDYNKLKDEGTIDRIPLIGKPLSVWHEMGIYEGNYFKNWMQEQLANSPVGKEQLPKTGDKALKFKHLVMPDSASDPTSQYYYRLNVVATDLTRGRLLRLPWDIADYDHTTPDELEVAEAVRTSMSIPFFFEPVKLKDKTGQTCYIVDGGVLSNYPIWIWDEQDEAAFKNPSWPTIGFKLVENMKDGLEVDSPNTIHNPLDMLKALFSTMMDAHDSLYIQNHNFARTVGIDTLGVGTVEFNIKPDRRDRLYQSGRDAAKKFFDEWDFQAWVDKYRKQEPESRTESVKAS